MKKPHKYAPRKNYKERSTAATIASLSALGLLTVGLSGFALFTHDRAGTSTASETDGGADSVKQPDREPYMGVESERSTNDDGTEEVAFPADRLIAVSTDPERVLRAEAAECGADEPSIDVSADGGQTWTPADTSTLELSGIRQLGFGNNGIAHLAFVNQQCEMQFAQSYVYGGAWEPSSDARGTWTLTEEYGENEILIAGTAVDTPCPTVSVSGLGNHGIILCDNSSASVTDDAGKTWGDLISVPAAQAVAQVDEEPIIATLDDAGCAGISVKSVSRKKVEDRGSCAEVDADVGQVAVAGSGTNLIVWAGEEIIRSDDSGATWDLV